MTTCVLIRYIDGSPDCWESLDEYLTNPTPGSYILTEHPKVQPVVGKPVSFELSLTTKGLMDDVIQKVLKEETARRNKFRQPTFLDLFPDK